MSIWYMSGNSGVEKPAEIDKTSSKVYNYIRKDFVEIPAQEGTGEGEEGAFMPGFSSVHWQYREAKIRKTDWKQFLKDNIYWLVADRKLNEAAGR